MIFAICKVTFAVSHLKMPNSLISGFGVNRNNLRVRGFKGPRIRVNLTRYKRAGKSRTSKIEQGMLNFSSETRTNPHRIIFGGGVEIEAN